MSVPWRLVHVNRPEGRIFSHKDISTPQEIPAVCFPWSGIRIPGSTIRLVSQPPSVCKIYRNSLTPLREKGIRLATYIDDWLVTAQSEQEAREHTVMLLEHIQKRVKI